jgi:hypothetical protein
LESIKKYNDEKWSDYLKRLRDYAKVHNFTNEDIIKKIRKEYSPQNLQIIFYTIDSDLNKIIERVLEIEQFRQNTQNKYIKKNFTKCDSNKKPSPKKENNVK